MRNRARHSSLVVVLFALTANAQTNIDLMIKPFQERVPIGRFDFALDHGRGLFVFLAIEVGRDHPAGDAAHAGENRPIDGFSIDAGDVDLLIEVLAAQEDRRAQHASPEEQR